MKITVFKVSADRTALELEIEDASALSSLKLWSNTNYKDYNEAEDLTYKLTGSANEVITIELSDLNLGYFDGVYFIEAQDNTSTSEAITADLTRYRECILKKIQSLLSCGDCLKTMDPAILNAQILLYSLQTAIQNGFIGDITSITEALNIYCSDDCKTCGEYKNVSSPNYYSTNE